MNDFVSPPRLLHILKAQSQEDELFVQMLQADKEHFLKKALQNYLLCLRTGVCWHGIWE